MSFTALQEELRKTGMPFSRSALQSSADEASTGDDSEGSSFQPASKRYMGSDATRYSSPTEDAGDGSPESVAPAPWTIPMPGSKHKELIPGQQEFYSNTDLFRVMQELQRATANPLDVVNPTPYLPQDAGYFSDELAKQWLQKEVAELADLMAQRESEMQSLHQQLTMISALQTPMSQPQAPQLNQGLEMQIHMLRNQLDEISQMMRLSQPGPPPQTFTKSQSPSQEDEILTVMMRNIPNKYTQKMLIEEVNSVGFQGTYDFVYLPIDKESGANKGYAFVNFLRPDYAYAFKRAFNGKQMAQFKSNKIVNVTPAAIQGFEANHEHFSRTRVNFGDPDARPLFLRKVQKVSPMRMPSMKNQLQKELPPQVNLPGSFAAWPAEAQAGFCTFCGARRSPVHQFCQGCGRTALQ